MAEQWQYTRLLGMRHLNYQVVDESVYIEGKRIGDVAYLASLDTTTMIAYAQQELKREVQAKNMADFEAVERRASRDGEMVGDFLLDVAPSVVNSRSLWWVVARIGKALGYVDTDANDAFKFAVMDKFDAYKRANPESIARQIGGTKSRSLDVIDSD